MKSQYPFLSAIEGPRKRIRSYSCIIVLVALCGCAVEEPDIDPEQTEHSPSTSRVLPEIGIFYEHIENIDTNETYYRQLGGSCSPGYEKSHLSAYLEPEKAGNVNIWWDDDENPENCRATLEISPGSSMNEAWAKATIFEMPKQLDELKYRELSNGERTRRQELYLKTGIGQQAVDLCNLDELSPAIASQLPASQGQPSPYLLLGGFSLDPKWNSNRIRVADLPQSPVDLQAALGATSGVASVPDLKVIYYPGEELILDKNAKIEFKINDELKVVECLNNPARLFSKDGTTANNPASCDDLFVRTRDKRGAMLAIERDLYSLSELANIDPERYSKNKYSGTVIFAKRIVLAGGISTSGYDLVLVADEIEAQSNAKITTTPTGRQHDTLGTGGAYNYGRGKPGYRGGDFVALARRMTGSLQVNTAGGRGQLGADDQYLPCQERCFACKSNTPEQVTEANFSYLQSAGYCRSCDGLDVNEASGWIIQAGYYCSGTAGVGGQGGDSGNVSLIGSDMPLQVKRLEQVAGPGSNGRYVGKKPYGIEAAVVTTVPRLLPNSNIPYYEHFWGNMWSKEHWRGLGGACSPGYERADELLFAQFYPGEHGFTNVWWASADKTNCSAVLKIFNHGGWKGGGASASIWERPIDNSPGVMDADQAYNIEAAHGHNWFRECKKETKDWLNQLISQGLCTYQAVKPENIQYNFGAGYYCHGLEPNPNGTKSLSYYYADKIRKWCTVAPLKYGNFFCPVGTYEKQCNRHRIVHRHCEMKPDFKTMYNCRRFPAQLILHNAVVGKSGRPGDFVWYTVDTPYLLKPLEPGIQDEVSSFTSGPFRTPTGLGTPRGELNNSAFIQAVHAFAPRSAELLLLQADYLYRSLTDRDLTSRDSDYVANQALNPNAQNRILKAQYLYDSVMIFAAEALDSQRFLDSIAKQNPFRAEASAAYTRKESLKMGLNFLGFSPASPFFAKPSDVQPLLEDIRDLYENSKADYQKARDLVAALQAGKGGIVTQQYLDVGYELGTLEREQSLALEKLSMIAARMKMTLQDIDDVNAEISENNGTDETTVTSCAPCLTDNLNQCVLPTIASEIELMEQCAQQKPCDFSCWWDRVFVFVKLVATTVQTVVSFAMQDWPKAFNNLSEALASIENAKRITETAMSAIDIIGDYVKLFTDEEGAGKPLAKHVSEVVNVVTQTVDAIKGVQTWENNSVAEMVSQISVNADATASGLQQNLTEIYNLQATIEGSAQNLTNPSLAWAHAKTIEDLIKRNQALNRTLPDLQRQHILAIQEYGFAKSAWDVLKSKIELAKSSMNYLNLVVNKYNNQISHAQRSLDVSVRSAGIIQDRLLLAKYLYSRSKDFLYLESNTKVNFTTNLLLTEDSDAELQENVDNVLREFVNSIKTMESGAVFDTIAPARFKVTYLDHLGEQKPLVNPRTEEESLQAICPEYITVQPSYSGMWSSRDLVPPTGCKLTKAAYDEEIINQLRQHGVATFEIYPESMPTFRDLSEEEKLNWNRSFSSADFYYTNHGFENRPAFKKRVLEVNARFLTENYAYQASSLGQNIKISHGPVATFLTAQDEHETFIFPTTSMQDACNAINSAMTTGQTSCSDMNYFHTDLKWSPAQLSTLSVDEFKTNSMFGTSLRGTWAIDIQEFLAQFTDEELDEFWNAFRGIQYQIKWVSIQ